MQGDTTAERTPKPGEAPAHRDISQALAALDARASARAERERFERRPWLVRAWLRAIGRGLDPG